MLASYPSNTTADVYVWSSNHCTAHATPEDSDSDTWMLATPLPLKEPGPSSEGMDTDSTSSSPEPAEFTSDHEESQGQMDLFRKLGFSAAQVRAVRHKLGLNADTNTVLGELVLAGVEQEEKNCSGLVPRGESPHEPHVSLPHAPVAWASTQEERSVDGDALKSIVIDGSNVAMSHGNKEVFSCLGIQLAVDYFLVRGHTNITVFVPLWRREQPRPDVPITDQHILRELEKRKILVFTPSRRVAGKRVVCYDDRFIVKLAYDSDGVIVSNDTYRDLQGEKPEWKRFIEDRLLMYSFVNDRFMVPDDPLGRHGPTLENFLRKTPRVIKRPPCPYGKKCTYGIKCKFSHPERPKQSHRALADELREKAKQSVSQTPPHKLHAAPASAGSPRSSSQSLEETVENKRYMDSAGPPPRKAQVSENVLVLKGVPPANRRQCSKRDRVFSASMDSFLSGSHDCLDSGLGSYDGHAERHNTTGDPRTSRSLQTRSQYYPPPSNDSQSCPCCSVPAPVPPPAAPTQRNPGYSHHCAGPAGSRGPDISSFPQPRYPPPYASPPHPASLQHYSMAAYSAPQPAGHSFAPQRGCWSAPYPGGCNQSVCRAPPGEPVQHHPWGAPPARANTPSSAGREEMRKKLMAIFNARLVDRAMDMFPQLMDPQRLAAEILTLQFQDGSL